MTTEEDEDAMNYLYAYDGSGVPMSTRVEVHGEQDGRILVSFPDFTPPFDRMTEIEDRDGRRWVRDQDVSGSEFALASWNWND